MEIFTNAFLNVKIFKYNESTFALRENSISFSQPHKFFTFRMTRGSFGCPHTHDGFLFSIYMWQVLYHHRQSFCSRSKGEKISHAKYLIFYVSITKILFYAWKLFFPLSTILCGKSLWRDIFSSINKLAFLCLSREKIFLWPPILVVKVILICHKIVRYYT